MHFAYPLPWWLALLLAAAIAAAVFVEYRRPLAPLTPFRRGLLASLRALTLAALVAFLFRPIALLPPAASRGAVVPVLVDASRSMRIADADGKPRIADAAAILKTRLMPALASQFSPALYRFGDGLTAIASSDVAKLSADARRTDLAGALAAVRERYRGQRVAGIIVLSDGGDTGEGAGVPTEARSAQMGPPVFTVGVGSLEGPRDREVLGITAGDPRIDQSSIDLHVTASSSGFGRAPFQLQVLANGQSIESRRLVPPADGSPIESVFTVSPNPSVPTVYTAQIAADDAEPVAENNQRGVLVSPSGRKRRLLVIEGAPGFEHSFMTRAWSADPGLEIDTVTRKGKNVDGQDTFFVQAGSGRAASLTSGFPASRDKLFAYDGIVIANVESDFFTRAQLQSAADFVSERGGGLLVLGGRSFAQRGMAGTPLEEVLPVELNDRRGVLRTTAMASGPGGIAGIDVQPHNKVTLTAEGEVHPVMRIGATPEETRKLWTAMPALAASAPLGGPRPGATVLALTAVPGGGLHPVVAVQRYGQGRSMVFAGEASWRWKMMMASTDRAFEFFWRQSARWLTSAAPDPVSVVVPDAPEPGDSIPIDVDARDAAFAPAPDASVDVTLTPPGGGTPVPLKMRHVDPASGRFSTAVRLDQPGLYRIKAEARRGSQSLGSVDRWMYVGGADREFADPRLNEALLRRIARASDGRYVRAADAARVIEWLKEAIPQNAALERRDLWHEPWAFALVAALMCAEWILPVYVGTPVKRAALVLAIVLGAARAWPADRFAVVITGASGGDAYAKKYDAWRTTFVNTLRTKFGYQADHVFVLAEHESEGVPTSTREHVRQVLTDLRKRVTKDDQLLVLLIGHGTPVDGPGGEDAKFNLVGPDLTATEWEELIKPIPGRLVFVNTSSASVPFLRKLAGRGRVVLTATDSAAQQYETVFADFFVKAFDDAAADADKNGRVSIWEAFTYASAGVQQWFEQKAQLPTERPLLDDTGAGIGREAQNPGTDGALARITYLQPEAAIALPSDTALATLVRRQADLQSQIEELKARKDQMPAEQYEAELERLLIELARVAVQIRSKS